MLSWEEIMRPFDYAAVYPSLLTPELVAMLGQIHECKGEQKLFIEAKADTLSELLEISKIQSTEASNRIEGIFTSDERLTQLVREKVRPKNRSEQEIAGYRDVLTTIYESHDYIPLKPSLLLQLHKNLYRFSGTTAGGTYKSADNVIQETDAQGNRFVRFQPVAAWETPEAVERACRAYGDAIQEDGHDPLLLIPVFILDFLCIYPFNDGNGRMSRLLTLLLLYRAGYIVGKYISLEKLIEDTKEPTTTPCSKAQRAGTKGQTTMFPLHAICWASSSPRTGSFPAGFRP